MLVKKTVWRPIYGVGLAVIGPLLFCSPVRPLEPGTPDPTYAGMKRINAADRSFSQGADDATATSDEKPVFSAGFSYNYWLDTTEVTQKEYADITGKRPVTDTSGFGVGDRYPVYNVSWFDAVLFCNAKSKRRSLDTVYS
jgi:formylglycine-generating enzyme required for sulfatase activity